MKQPLLSENSVLEEIKIVKNYRIIKLINNLKSILPELLNMLILIFGVISLKYFTSSDSNKGNFNIIEAGFEGMGGAFLMSELTNKPVKKFFGSFSRKFLPQSFLSQALNKRMMFEERLELIKKKIPETRIKAIEEMLHDWDLYLYISENYATRLEGRLKIMMSLPYKKLQIKDATIPTKVDELLACYPDKISKDIKSFVQDVVLNTHNHHENGTRVQPIFLLGPPGVGKTRLIGKLTEILGIACYKIQVASLKRDDIFGSGPWGDSNFKNGIFIDALLHSAKFNDSEDVCIFLDEIDKAMKLNEKSYGAQSPLGPWLLEALNADIDKVRAETFGFDVGIRRVILIMAGNEKFTKEKDALDTRFTTLEFPPLGLESKRKIANEHFDLLMHEMSMDISDTDRLVINDILDKDKYPGVRVLLRAINAYVRAKQIQSIFEGSSWEDHKFDVKDFYACEEGQNKRDSKTKDVGVMAYQPILDSDKKFLFLSELYKSEKAETTLEINKEQKEKNGEKIKRSKSFNF